MIFHCSCNRRAGILQKTNKYLNFPLFRSSTAGFRSDENRVALQDIFCWEGDSVRLPLQGIRETKEFRGRTKSRDRR